MATAPKLVPPPPLYVTVPPPQDVPGVQFGQQVIFQSMNQNFNICFGVNASWPSISGQAYTNQARCVITAPNLNTSIQYNVVFVGTNCVVSELGDAAKTIHVGSGAKHQK